MNYNSIIGSECSSGCSYVLNIHLLLMQAGWNHLQNLILENKRGKHGTKSCIFLWVQVDFCSSIDLGTNSLLFSITPFYGPYQHFCIELCCTVNQKDRNSHVTIFHYSTANHLSFHLYLPLDENYAVPTGWKKHTNSFFYRKEY